MVVDMVGGPVTTYASYDIATPQGNDGGESELLYLTECLNTLNYPGLPPHLLELKIRVPAILLRNIRVAGGLCNGTRMIVTQLLTKADEAKIITGTRVGEKNLLPEDEPHPQRTNITLCFKKAAVPTTTSLDGLRIMIRQHEGQ
ncbi:uncharacterized protein [Rutidosis leptorrhynchoides]|uniref:uncharacterized protein n=1 Tax=Rutidosis leptorrhynchoides TaxID=125765 RepID=UPI003A997687